MKKFYMLIAAVMVFGCSYLAWAGEVVNVPTSKGSNPLDSASYGGVDIATSSFSSSFATACLGAPVTSLASTGSFDTCTGVVQGVYISSSGNADFVDVFDSTTGAITPTDDKFLFRVYSSSGTPPNGIPTGTWTWLNYPVRFNNGLVFKPSAATLNKVSVFYYRRRE